MYVAHQQKKQNKNQGAFYFHKDAFSLEYKESQKANTCDKDSEGMNKCLRTAIDTE
jgi:hypothetical protein